MLREINIFKLNAERFNCGDIELEKFKNTIKCYGDNMNQYCFRTSKAIEIINKSIIKKYLTRKKGEVIILENDNKIYNLK